MLNKNGWGFRSFIIGGSILLIALLVATFFIIRLYRSLPNLTGFIVDPVDYQTIEETLDSASLNYINDYYNEEITTGVIVVSTDNLLKYNIINNSDLIQTTNNDLCSGYSLISKEDGKLISKSYISCDNYTSDGYQSWRVANNE
jgi:hypothetical protein